MPRTKQTTHAEHANAPAAPDEPPSIHGFVDDDGRVQRAMEVLGITFRNPALLHMALVHRSYLNELGVDGEEATRQSNERLEFLGDALLGMICAEYVYAQFPESPEGILTLHRVSLVRTETLAAWTMRFGLERLTYVARGEVGPNGELRPRVLAGLFEAVLAAIYLDRGMRVAKRFMRDLLDEDAGELIDTGEPTNYKGRLQELIQNRERVTPGYRTVKTSGPAHDRHFIVEAVLRGQQIGTGSGANKRTAEQEAARDALARLALEGIVENDGRPV